MLPWRRASICNRDNSWGMKALRRGRVTSGIQITDNSNQSKSNFLRFYRRKTHKKNKQKKKAFLSETRQRRCYVWPSSKPEKPHTYTLGCKNACLNVSWTIWIQAMSDPDSRMSYYRDKTQAHARAQTHTHPAENVLQTPDRWRQEGKGIDKGTNCGNRRPRWLGYRLWPCRLIESRVNPRIVCVSSVVKI